MLGACLLASRPVVANEPQPLETPAPPRQVPSPPFLSLPPGGLKAGEPAAPFYPGVVRPPLDPPLTVNGGFGEYRAGHFHAGVDLGTGARVGKPVYAPLSGRIVRVRTSGVGYGRSLYLAAQDGRLIQLGHLDAFAEPMASYAAAVQESTGQYEQDLWPEPGRFPVRAGQVIAWSGESGAGGPHLHFEIRRVDMALNPFRAGLVARDRAAPSIVSLTLEPLDGASFVERCAAPYTIRFGAKRDTLRVEGRLRAIVGARDGVWRGVDRMVPWSVSMEFGGRQIECRFDSLSWATDMPEGDYVYDAGRVVGEKGIVLWAPGGFRPRAIRADGPADREAGTIEVRPGDPPRRLRLTARDLAGGMAVRTVVLRPPGERGPDSTRAGGLAFPVAGDDRFEFAALPGGCVRVVYRGAAAGSRGVWLDLGAEGRAFAAGTRGADWSAVIPRGPWSARWWVVGRDSRGRPWREPGPPVEWTSGDGPAAEAPGFLWSLPGDARFEPGLIGRHLRPAPETAPPELAPVEVVGRLEPERLTLRRPMRIVARRPGAGDSARVGLYRHGADGWDYLGAKPGAGANTIEAESRRLGTFALFADTVAPRIVPLAPPRAPGAGPYSRWALEARLTEEGSGVDPRGSAFEVDDVRVPSEWDAEQDVLRWRPLHAPAAGVHRFTVVATDRAGNVARRAGTFVLD
ncbi:MAG TPA: M23 family metallopeptidase [Candidatus Eisenbacteria bacterium]